MTTETNKMKTKTKTPGRIMSRQDVAYVFARRPWLRPSDYEDIKNHKTNTQRHRDLAAYCLGILSMSKSNNDIHIL